MGILNHIFSPLSSVSLCIFIFISLAGYILKICSNFMLCSSPMKGGLKWVKRNGISSVSETESTQLV